MLCPFFQYLCIRNNPIHLVHQAAFRGTNLLRLSISVGHLKYFPRVGKYCVDLDESILNQSIQTNESLGSCGWDKLASLRLFYNQLTEVPVVDFLQFQLIELGLGFNQISSLSNMCNINYTVLKSLYLNDNRISHINFACFIMPRLENVFLNRNLLKFIGDLSMSTLGEYLEPGEHTTIELSINPIHCGPNLSWILEALHADHYLPGDYFYQRHTGTPVLHNMQRMQCYSPDHLKGRFIIDLGTHVQYITCLLQTNVCFVILLLYFNCVYLAWCKNIFINKPLRWTLQQ